MFLGNLFEFCFGYLFCLLDLFRPQAAEAAAAAPAEAAQAPVEAAVAAEAPVATEIAATAEAVVPAEVAPAVDPAVNAVDGQFSSFIFPGDEPAVAAAKRAHFAAVQAALGHPQPATEAEAGA